MQISVGEVEKVLKGASRPAAPPPKRAASVHDLADEHGISRRELHQQVECVRAADEDPWRERRVRELKARVEAGTYRVEAEAIVDMAERRAIADRAGGR